MSPPPRRPAVPSRRHVVLLGVIGAAALLRGLYWVAVTEVWNPIDEAQHFAYVEHLATGKGIPRVRDVVSREVLDVAKSSPTYLFLSRPVLPHDPDEGWGGSSRQYEAVQGPTYYALMVPAYWAGRPFGFVASIYTVRVATMLLALTALPLTWLIARVLFPQRPAAWLMSAAFLALLVGFNANLASITNDALLLPLCAVTTLAFLRALQTVRPRHVALAGGLFGLAVLTKTTALSLVFILGVAAIPTVGRLWGERARLLRIVATFVVAASLPVVPWVAWNYYAYGAPSAAAEATEVTKQERTGEGLDIGHLVEQINSARGGLWTLQPYDPGGTHYQLFWEGAFLVVVGAAVLGRRRRPRASGGDELVRLGWLAGALPLALAGMFVIVYGVFGGAGAPVGRRLYPALPLVAVLFGSAPVVLLGLRAALVAVSLVAAAALHVEVGFAHSYVHHAYEFGVVDERMAPVVSQPWNERYIVTRDIRIDAPCPVEVLAFGFIRPPGSMRITVGDEVATASKISEAYPFEYYRLDQPLEGELAVAIPGEPGIAAQAADDLPEVSSIDSPGEVMVLVYCEVDDPEAAIFARRFPPLHPPLSRSFVLVWPEVWRVLGILGVGAALWFRFAVRR